MAARPATGTLWMLTLGAGCARSIEEVVMRRSSRPAFAGGGVLLVACTVLFASAPAYGASARGVTYAGSTSTSDPIVVQLAHNGKRVVRVNEMWTGECTSGESFPMGGSLKADIKVSRSGAFTATRRPPAVSSGDQMVSLTETIAGRIRGRSLTGSIRATLESYDQAGTLTDSCKAQVTFKGASAKGRVFGGTTSQDMPAVLELNGRGTAVKHLHFGWQADCADGGFMQYGDTVGNFLLHGGRFGDSWQSDYNEPSGETEHVTYDIAGGIRGRGVTGAARVRFTQDDASGNQTSSCDTGAVKWSATSG